MCEELGYLKTTITIADNVEPYLFGYDNFFCKTGVIVIEVEIVNICRDDATGFDEVTLLGEAVRGTERMKIGTAIMSVFTRSPTVLAQTFASLDLLSGGRMVIGLGASSAE